MKGFHRPLVAFLVLAIAHPPARSEEVLLGKVRPKTILAISGEWERTRDSYAPAASDLRALAGLSRKATLEVYFGSWCSDSQREVPRLLKILDEAAPRCLNVRFYALDRSKKQPARLIEGVGIEKVPTFVLTVDGREIGRIVETPETTLEHDLALLIARIPAGRP